MTDQQWLILNLEAPLMSFGGVLIDHIGETRDFPTQSAITGLFANAMGWRRTDYQLHQRLQDHLVFAARAEHTTDRLTDTQNAKLEKNDKGWTTRGGPEGRDGASYGAPHRRLRHYLGDAHMLAVVSLNHEDESISIEKLKHALSYPARPIFIGRKTCLPSAPLYQGTVIAKTAYQALSKVPGNKNLRAIWPIDSGPVNGNAVHRVINISDKRRWQQGLHGGSRKIVEGTVSPEETL